MGTERPAPWALAAVDPTRRRVRTNQGREVVYDVLVIATGAAAAEPPELPVRRLEIDDLEPYLTPK